MFLIMTKFTRDILMKTFFSIIVLFSVLLLIASAKVLIRTNAGLGLLIIVASGLILVLCWFFLKLINHRLLE